MSTNNSMKVITVAVDTASHMAVVQREVSSGCRVRVWSGQDRESGLRGKAVFLTLPEGLLEPKSFQKPAKKRTPKLKQVSGKVLVSFRKPSRTFRNCSETEQRKTSLPISFRKPSEASGTQLKQNYVVCANMLISAYGNK